MQIRLALLSRLSDGPNMPRPLRVEYEGARYHIMCRGNRGAKVFERGRDVQLWLKTLSEAVTRTDWRVHAWVLMSTHYHLLLETPQGNLVEGMKWFQGAFTQRMNAMHKTWGHLFQGRYKAKIIEQSDPEYFRKVASYIHLNPAAAGLVDAVEGDLSRYAWSSYPEYLKPPSRRREILHVDLVLGHYHLRDTVQGRRQYRDLMQSEAEALSTRAKRKHFYSSRFKGMERGWVHGSKEFRDEMSDQILEAREEGPGATRDREQKWDMTDRAVRKVITCGCGYFGIAEYDLMKMKKGAWQKTLLAAYIKEHYSMPNREISRLLHMGDRSQVGRSQSTIRNDKKLTKQYQRMAGEIERGTR